MSDLQAITVANTLRYPFVAGVIDRLKATEQVLSNAYGVALSADEDGNISSGGTNRSNNRDFNYDIYDTARTLSGFRAPDAGPYKRKRFPIGQQRARGLRSFVQMPFGPEELRNYRVQGGMPGEIDAGGQRYIRKQVRNLMREMMNTREFVFTRMLKGSLSIQVVGQEYRPVASGGDFTVDFGLPAAHKSQLALGSGGADLITASWATASTDIVAHLLSIWSESFRLTGMPMTEIWINSVMWGNILNNTKLQAQGGTAFRTWEEMEKKRDGTATYFTRTLRSTGPQFKFHVYDGGLQVGTQVHNSTDRATWTKFIGDNEAIMTPSFDQSEEWFDWYEISEWVKEGYTGEMKEVYGFHSWNREDIQDEMPRTLWNVLDNYAPALTVPKAIFNPTVVF